MLKNEYKSFFSNGYHPRWSSFSDPLVNSVVLFFDAVRLFAPF